ncbi:class I SAM-dependent methyltransferase [Methylobacterium sp. HMF5984]|uniref:class I SAM-dependent methyltransferase n=1 Tax=Methylobacterium sp. HMF5984 TaxID=3367370 RepID=UPI003852C419
MPDEQILPNLNERHVFTMPDRIVASAWLGHIPFSKWLVGIHQPSITVELGVHNGASLCAMAEAANDVGHAGAFFGVDHWIGDAHAGSHTIDTYWNLKAYVAARPLDALNLMRMSFDDALPHFDDGSVDLLHIDGLHTYEAVRHDLETWLLKLSRRGIVLFHDIRVLDNNFGVWQLWNEVSQRYPSFDFDHSYGLGVIYVGSDPMLPWMDQLFGGRIEPHGQLIRDYFARLGGAIVREQEYLARGAELLDLRQQLDASRAQAHDFHLSNLANNQAIAAIESFVSSSEGKIQSLRRDNETLRSALAGAQVDQADLNVIKAELAAVNAASLNYKEELNAVRADRDAAHADRDAACADRNAIIAERNSILLESDTSILRRQELEAELKTAWSDIERERESYTALLQWSVSFHDSTAASLSWKLTRPLRLLKIGRPKRPGPPPDGL